MIYRRGALKAVGCGWVPRRIMESAGSLAALMPFGGRQEPERRVGLETMALLRIDGTNHQRVKTLPTRECGASSSARQAVSIDWGKARPRSGSGSSPPQAHQAAPQFDALRTVARRLVVPLAILTFGIAMIALFGDLAQSVDYHKLVTALRHTPMESIRWSICATAVSFAALVGRDACAVRYVGSRAPLLAPLLAGFCGSALGNAVGIGALTGAAASTVRSASRHTISPGSSSLLPPGSDSG
jgi:hypothetical protein